MIKKLGSSVLLVIVIALSVFVSSCDWFTTKASLGSCAFEVDGYNKYVGTILPGQPIDLSGITTTYVPCNPRNVIINDGSIKNANGEVVGDRAIPFKAYTKQGTAIYVQASAFWTLNQSPTALKDFFAVCHKYDCASAEDKGGNVNSSTPGWNKMLAENFIPPFEAATRIAASLMDDEIWKTHDPNLYKILANNISENIADAIRGRLGYSIDLFCGSGDKSYWSDPSNPGHGTYTCSSILITVEIVDAVPNQDIGSSGAAALNAVRLTNARALYSEHAEEVLGAQDTLKICLDAGSTTCAVNADGTGFVMVPGNPTPLPTPTPAKK